MEGSESSCESLIVTSQPAESSRLGKPSFHNPSSWQQHEAVFGLGMRDHFQPNTVLGLRLFSSLACVALIHVSQFNILLRDLLHLPGQFSDLRAILLIGRRDMQSQQMALRIVAAEEDGKGIGRIASCAVNCERSGGSNVARSFPTSMRTKSSSPFTSLSSRRALRWSSSRFRGDGGVWLVMASSMGPSMSVSGVRNSWLTLLKNVVLARSSSASSSERFLSWS